MIVDNIKNASQYYCFGEKFEKALKYLEQNDLMNFDIGTYEISGEDVYVIVQDYTSKKPEMGEFEAHKKHADIQFIIKGQERLGYTHISNFEPNTEYDEERDLIFGDVKTGSLVLANPDDFLIFMPHDAHMPGICMNKPYYVKKAVVKIKL